VLGPVAAKRRSGPGGEADTYVFFFYT